MAASIDLSGEIPPQYSTQILAEAAEQSAALALGTRVPMGTKVSQMPVPKTFPRAAFVSTGGRKPYTDLSLDKATMTAEEIASVVSIPDEYLEDTSINLWGYARPLIAEAIGAAFDDAVFWGTDAPDTYPAGGINAVATQVPTGDDPIDTINDAMSAVEAGGIRVTGNAADTSVLGSLRGVRDQNGALLLGAQQINGQNVDSIYGVPTKYSAFSTEATGDFITGAWRYLLIGVRSDIRYKFSTEGVIADENGKVIVAAFQDNQTLLKVWARFAVAIIKPVTRRKSDGASPFAITNVVGDGGEVAGKA